MATVRSAVALAVLAMISGCGRAEPLHVLAGHPNYVRTLAFSPDGTKLAAGDSNGCLKIWDVRDGVALQTLLPGVPSKDDVGQVDWVEFSPDGKILASSWDDISLWDTATGKRLQHLKGHHAQVTCVAFSPDGKTLASGSPDNAVKLWSVESGKELGTLSGHLKGVLSLAFSPDGSSLASGGGDGSIIFWNVAARSARSKIDPVPSEPKVLALTYLKGGTMLASRNSFSGIQLWDASNGTHLRNLKADPFETMNFSSDGKTAILALNFGEDTTLRLINVENGDVTKLVTRWNSHPTAVAASPDRKIFALATNDSKITLWRMGN